MTAGSSSASDISCHLSSEEAACCALLPCTKDPALPLRCPEEVGVVVGVAVGEVLGPGVLEGAEGLVCRGLFEGTHSSSHELGL